MKLLLIALLSLPVLSVSAQNNNREEKTVARHILPDVTLTAPKLDKEEEWKKSVASHIPLKAHTPYYDTVVRFSDELTRDDMEANAVHYFTKIFNSRSYRLETEKHNYTGYGNYLFCADKRIGATALYKVYYRVDITVKGNKYYVDMYDFTLENQHAEVSFAYLMKNAKDNDLSAKKILEQFHNINQQEMKKIYASMSGADRSGPATASNEGAHFYGEARKFSE